MVTAVLCVVSDAAPRLLQENQRYLSQLTSLMQEAADEQTKSIVVSSLPRPGLLMLPSGPAEARLVACHFN